MRWYAFALIDTSDLFVPESSISGIEVDEYGRITVQLNNQRNYEVVELSNDTWESLQDIWPNIKNTSEEYKK